MPLQIQEWLQKQEEYSMLPPSKGLLIETFTRNNFGFRKNYLVHLTGHPFITHFMCSNTSVF